MEANTSRALPAVWVDALKAMAAQLIVWHHFLRYGPHDEAARAAAPDLLGWVARDGRLAVQVFLVVGGFLSAPSLLRAFGVVGARPGEAAPRSWFSLVVGRWLRLVKPFAVALLAAMLAAALARALLVDADTPAAPTLVQFLAHVFLIHDGLGLPALTVGVWYVAIDFQLYALAALWAWAVARAPAAVRMGLWAGGWLLALAASALLFNRDAAGDAWAPYFLAAYALGVVAWMWRARWPTGGTARRLPALAAAGTVLAALMVEWRVRLGLAAGVALLLAVLPAWPLAAHGALARTLQRLGRHSYALFLMHYPVMLAAGAMAAVLGVPTGSAAAAWGVLAVAWLLSMAAAAWLHGAVETPAPRAVQAQGSAARRPSSHFAGAAATRQHGR